MAYRHFDSDTTSDWTPVGTLSATTAKQGSQSILTLNERQVVELSRRDATATLRAPGRFGKIAKWLFGHQPANRLASPRLEALRRFAVLRRVLGDAVPAAEIERLAEAGYSPRAIKDIDQLLQDRTNSSESAATRWVLIGRRAKISL